MCSPKKIKNDIHPWKDVHLNVDSGLFVNNQEVETTQMFSNIFWANICGICPYGEYWSAI